MSQTLTVPEKVVEYVGCSSAALEKAAAAMGAYQEREKRAMALIPKAVDALVANERITEEQREKAAEVCADPVQCLELLIKVANHRNKDEMGQLGAPVEKTAGANGQHNPSNSLSSPHVGARTTMTKQSDVNLFSRLGLAPPTE